MFESFPVSRRLAPRGWRAWVAALGVLWAGGALAEPWRLGEALGVPEVLALEVDHRTRYEYLDEQFRLNRGGKDEWVVFRTRVRARLSLQDWLVLGAELQDSRITADTQRAPVGTGAVNPVELLRAYVEVSGGTPFGGRQVAQLGRITMDVGSRRLVARNRMRNTANAFTGLDWRWMMEGGGELRAFYTLPVVREPRDIDDRRDNKIEFDEESFDRQFWGLFYTDRVPGLTAHDVHFEVYWFGLHVDDRNPDLDIDIHTPGFRLYRKKQVGRADFQLENVIQFGESETLSLGGADHLAHIQHAQLGYTFDVPWSPRLAVLYDYASGNDSPTSNDTNRFNTLFGARRFENGPTSLFGPFARTNINSPGVRVEVTPLKGLTSFVAVRPYWLAEARGAWVPAAIVAPIGAPTPDRYVGTQAEVRVRWDIFPKNLRLEVGYAHLFSGDFVRDATGSALEDANFVYPAVEVGF